jgi:hypothetical protein
MQTMTREQVYRLIDGEREYQALVEADASRCNQDIKETPHTAGEYFCMLQAYMTQFPQAWLYSPDGSDEILSFFRKMAAICVHAMEDHGAPSRVAPRN